VVGVVGNYVVRGKKRECVRERQRASAREPINLVAVGRAWTAKLPKLCEYDREFSALEVVHCW
jgi:hypothetical protein